MGPVAGGDGAAFEAGAAAAASAAEAVRDAQVVITMLPTAEIVSSVIFDGGAAEAFAEGAVWAQMGTIGVTATTEIAGRLGQLRPDVMFVDAPVSGSKGPAQSGQLLILASGPPEAQADRGSRPSPRSAERPCGSAKAGQGTRMKLVVNAYMSVVIEGVAEALELARRLGIDAARARGGHRGRAAGRAHRRRQAAQDGAGRFRTGVPSGVGAQGRQPGHRDAGHGSPPLLEALSRQWQAAVDAGHGREDVSAAVLALHGNDQ